MKDPKIFFIMPFEFLTQENVIAQFKKRFPELAPFYCVSTFYIDENLAFFEQGDTVVFEDDTQYTITSLMKVYKKTQKEIIIYSPVEQNFIKVIITGST